MSTAGIR